MTDEKRFFRRMGPDFERRLITREMVLSTTRELAKITGLEMLEYGVALNTLSAWFGLQWAERHIMDDAARRGFFNQWGGAGAHSVRKLCDLTDMLLNFQRVSGVEACFGQIAAGEMESAFAELEAGKILRFSGTPFRFILPSGKPGENFDVELIFNSGSNGCAEVKCKLEATDVSCSALRNSLDYARKKLPADYPGVVVVKLPAKWAMTHEATDAVTQTIDDFLRSTNRVVAVLQFYARHALRGGSVETDYQINEVISHSHRFGGSPEDWMILRHQPVRPFGWMSIHNVIKQVAGELATTPHGP